MNNKNSLEYRQKLNEVIIEKRQELEHRQNRLNNNIFAGTCHKSIEEIKMEKILVKNLACCKNKTAPQFGCTDRYYKNKKKYNKKYRSKYKYKKPRRRYYVKNYKTKRP